MAGDVKHLHIGGQAVFEGVMLKSDSNLAIAVRKKNKIVTKKEKLKKKNKFLKLPLIRGIANLIEMLHIGLKALIWSSNQALGEDEKLTTKETVFMILTSFIIVVLFFILLPFYLTKWSGVTDNVLFNVIDGIFRIGIFIGYILLISLMKDAKTLFRYHGAEHKVVHCHEAKKPLTLKNAKKFSPIHTRCGTSFIVIVLLLSIFIFTFITTEHTLTKVGLRILLIPLIASLSYEVLKFGARHHNNIIFKLFALPGTWFQRLTTKEPTDKQIEVALATMKTLLSMEKK